MKKILVFISDEYADWESSYVCSELNKEETGYEVKTVALSSESVRSMGGFTVIPDYTINNIPDNFELLILVGGLAWAKGENKNIKPLIDLCVSKKIPVAAICDACTFLASEGYLDNVEHTGNSVEYLKQVATNYKGERNFIEKQVVANDKFITANGTSAVEFAREILRYLNINPQGSLENWYQLYKDGYYKE